MLSSSSIILLLVCAISLVSSQDCNEVTFTVTVPLANKDLGSFSLSTGRCQALKFLIPEFKFEVQMSLYFECDGDDLKVSIYKDLYCQQINGNPYQVGTDDDIKILSGLAKITIDSLACDKYECYGEFIYTENCTSSLSTTYFSLSFPFGTCLSLNTLENNDDEEGAKLNGNAVSFHCCEKTYDLLLYNYSSTDCDTDATVYRFDSKYNGKCFKVMRDGETDNNDHSNNNDIGGMFNQLNRRFLQESNDEHQDGVFMFSYDCPKDHFVECGDIDLVDDTNFPPQCDDTCKDALQSHDATANGNDDGDSKSGNNHHHNGGSGKSATILATLFGGIAVILAIIIVAVFRKNKKLKKELNNEQEIVIGKEKYEPMIEESGPNVIDEGTGNVANDIILPTDDNEDEIQPVQTEIVSQHE